MCVEAVQLITFGDLKDFIKHALEKFPMVVNEAIDSCSSYKTHLLRRLLSQPAPVIFTPKHCGELLAGANSLSERAYINTRRILMQKNVFLATYDSTVKYLRSLDVGIMKETGEICQGLTNEPCEQCFVWNIHDTLQHLMKNESIVERMKFPTDIQQHNLFEQLKKSVLMCTRI